MMQTRFMRASAAALMAAVLLGAEVAAAAPAAEPPGKVDLNQATQAELEALPGIGPALAARIVEYREERGPFQRIEDLMNVKGIGEKNFLRIRDRVTVGERTPGKR